METGARISAIGHGVLIVLAVFGLPWFGPREREPIRVTDVSFISEAEFEAAQAAAPAELPRRDDAPAEVPAAAPPPETAEPVEPEVSDEAPEIASVEPPAEIVAPESPDRVVPKVVTIEPPTAAAPPRPRPAPRVEPTPSPAVDARPAELPKPEAAPSPEPDVAKVEDEPAAPPEAAPVLEEATEMPPAKLALTTSGRPKARKGNQAPPRETAEAAVIAAVKAAQAKPAAKPKPDPKPKPAAAATPATEPTAPTAPTVTEPTEARETSLPVGPPLSNSEKDGLKLAVQRCWNVPAGVRDAQELKVTLAAELGADGSVINASIKMIEPRTAPDARFQQAFEAGRRALIRCSPYTLPREKYAQWRNIEVVFNPEGMVSW